MKIVDFLINLIALVFWAIVGLVFLGYFILVCIIALAGIGIVSAILGVLCVGIFGDYGFWPGFILGVIISLVFILGMLFGDIDSPVPAESKPRDNRSLLPFLLGLWIGHRMD